MPTAPRCPRCKQPILADNINVAKDIAFCRTCNVGHVLSDLIHGAESEIPIDLQHPPAGIWCETDTRKTVFGATHRSWGAALMSLGFCLFWNGIVSVFVAVALSGTFHHLGIVTPPWFPKPEMNGEVMSLGTLTFLWLFLTPFIVVGTGMFLAFLSAIGGKTEVRIQDGQGIVFVGIGSLGWTRRFNPTEVKNIELGWSRWRNTEGNSNSQTVVQIEEHTGRTVKFGSMLNDERKKFLLSALRKILL